MCNSIQNVVSALEKPPVIDVDTISADCTMTNNHIIMEFHEPGPPTCVGNEGGDTRHFHFPMSEFATARTAIAGGKTIRIRAKQTGTSFTKVKWEGV